MNIVEHVSLLYAGESSGYMPRSGMTGSSGGVMPNFLRNRQTDFQLMAIINRAAMNVVDHVSLLHGRESTGYMPMSGIVGSSGSVMPSFQRNSKTDFQSACTNLQPHQQWRSVPLSLHPLQHLLSPEFLILAILTGVR